MTELVLHVEPHLGEPFSHAVSADSLVFGRSSKADLVVPDRYISRQQARLFRDGDRWLIEDLGGRNPTLLNGKALTQPERVVPGDLISFSETKVYVNSSADIPRPAADSGHTLFRPASALLGARETQASEADLGEAGLRQRTNRLRLLNEFHRALAAPINLKDLLELVLDRAFADLRPEEGAILLRREDGEFEQVASRRVPGVAGGFLYSRSLIREVTEKGLAALVVDAGSDERFAAAQSIVSSGVRSLVAAPLLDSEGCPGRITQGRSVAFRVTRLCVVPAKRRTQTRVQVDITPLHIQALALGQGRCRARRRIHDVRVIGDVA